MNLIYNNETYNLTDEQAAAVENILGIKKFPLRVKDFDTFEISDIEFIKFPSKNGTTPIMTRDILFDSMFGNDANINNSVSLIKRMRAKVLKKVEAVLGSENVLEFTADLTAMDGLKEFDYFRSKICLPTFDFVRNYAKELEKYNSYKGYWTVTPFSVSSRDYARKVCCVRSDGVLDWCDCGSCLGVRPVLFLDSSIFEY